MLKARLFTRRNFFKNTVITVGALSSGLLSPSILKARSNSIPEVSKSPRNARVLSISLERIAQSKDVVDKVVERIERMSAHDPDVICIPEVFATTVKTAEEIDGPLVSRFRSLAEKYNSYIICPLHLKKDGKIYNTAVLIDRKGNIAGQYDKIYPTEAECNIGISPGSFPPPVFQTDFGKIGILICFDVNWIEAWKSLKEQGVEIVFWTAAYPGGRMLSSYAWRFQYNVVGCSRRDPSSIYDLSGDTIDKSGTYEHWAFASLNLEKILLEIDFHNKKIRAIRKKYGNKVKIKYYHDEDWVTVESNSPDLPIQKLIDEYDLLIRTKYIERAENHMDKFR